MFFKLGWTRELTELHSLDKSRTKSLGKSVGSIDFKLVVSESDDVLDASILQSLLSLHECVQLPLGVVLGDVLILGSR